MFRSIFAKLFAPRKHKNQWEIYRVPEVLIIDNSIEFSSTSIDELSKTLMIKRKEGLFEFIKRIIRGIIKLSRKEWKNKAVQTQKLTNLEPIIYHRKLSSFGVTFMNLIYQNPELKEIAQSMGYRPIVQIRVDPEDIGNILVLDPRSGTRWITASCITHNNAKGLSLEKRKLEIEQEYISRVVLPKVKNLSIKNSLKQNYKRKKDG